MSLSSYLFAMVLESHSELISSAVVGQVPVK